MTMSAPAIDLKRAARSAPSSTSVLSSGVNFRASFSQLVRSEVGQTIERRTISLMGAEKRERLHRFPEPHLVGQDAAEIVRREAREPVEAGELILAQCLRERAEFRFRIRRRIAARDEFL